MRINLGCIGRLGDESTRLKVMDMSKDNPNILRDYESFVALMVNDKTNNIKSNLEITLVEKEANQV